MKTAILPLATGFEEIEAITIVDVLRRARMRVLIAGVHPDPVVGAHDLRVHTDAPLCGQNGAEFDLVVLPGGMPGSEHLRRDPRVQTLLKQAHDAGNWIAALCAAPMALSSAGVLRGRRFTCYPGFAEHCGDGHWHEAPVVTDGKLITACGPGAALPFALEIVRQMQGVAVAEKLAQQMLFSAA